MSIVVTDYLIELAEIDWSAPLKAWAWLLPPEFTVWLANRFADLFLVLPDGTVHMLDVACGELEKVAESRDDFCAKIDQPELADGWLLIPRIDQLVTAGVKLEPGQCYGFKILPILGGKDSVSNVSTLSISDYLGACGSLHEQIRDLPDGAEIVLKVLGTMD